MIGDRTDEDLDDSNDANCKWIQSPKQYLISDDEDAIRKLIQLHL